MSEEKGNYEVKKTDQEAAVMQPESSLLFDDAKFARMEHFAEIMATGTATIPAHFRGSKGDCFAVIMQAAQWGMNPYAVAQKTHLVKGTLGYESQLVNAAIISMAPITGRLEFEWYGPWEKVVGQFQIKKGPNGDYQVPGWKPADEKGCGVKVWGTMKGEDKPRVLELLLVQATVRNSTLWAGDPKQQLAYLAVKRWSRLYCPDVILGVYTPDELEEKRPPMKNITPKEEKSGQDQSNALLDKLKDKSDATTVEAEIVEDPKNTKKTTKSKLTVSEILEAEIKKSGAPIVFDDLSAYMKQAKAAGPDIETLCKTPTWDKWFRENYVVLVKSAAEWKVTQAEKAE